VVLEKIIYVTIVERDGRCELETEHLDLAQTISYRRFFRRYRRQELGQVVVVLDDIREIIERGEGDELLVLVVETTDGDLVFLAVDQTLIETGRAPVEIPGLTGDLFQTAVHDAPDGVDDLGHDLVGLDV